MKSRRLLSRDMLKYIAIFAMLLDHIAWYFLEFTSPAAQAFHFIGRLTAPIMCFFIAQGYIYTKSFKKYALRLLIFALISQLPWCFVHGDSILTLSFNMIFTLFISLLAVHVEATMKDGILKLAVIILCVAATHYCDWHYYAVIWCLIFYRFRNDSRKMHLCFSLVSLVYFADTLYNFISAGNAVLLSFIFSLYALGTLLCIPLLCAYNGEKGKFRASKWVFYVFYPLHLFILGAIKWWIMK